MDTPLTFEADCTAAAANLYLRDAAGRVLVLPSDRAHRVAFATVAAPLPFAPVGCEGVAMIETVLATQIDLTGNPGGGATDTVSYALLLRGSRGWFHARVSGVSLTDPAPGEPHDSALPLLDRLTEGLTEDRRALTLDPEQADARAKDGEALLVLRTGSRRIALPARSVERVAPHQGAWSLRRGGADERVVALDGDLLPGCSLAVWLDTAREVAAPAEPTAEAAEGEGWVAVMRVEGRCMAVTFTALDGLITAPPDRIRALIHRGHSARHCLDPERGAIEILDPDGFLVSLPEGADARISSDGEVDTARRTGESEPLPVPDGGLAATAGPFVCVFSRGAVDRLLTGTGLGRVDRERRPGAEPVFDLPTLLGLPRPDAQRARAGRLLRLNRPGRRSVLLFVDSVGPTESTPDWQALPSVPPLVDTLFSALRLVGPSGVAQLLVHDRLRTDRVVGQVAVHLAAAHLGWCDPRTADG